jgi:hypothetical protein
MFTARLRIKIRRWQVLREITTGQNNRFMVETTMVTAANTPNLRSADPPAVPFSHLLLMQQPHHEVEAVSMMGTRPASDWNWAQQSRGGTSRWIRVRGREEPKSALLRAGALHEEEEERGEEGSQRQAQGGAKPLFLRPRGLDLADSFREETPAAAAASSSPDSPQLVPTEHQMIHINREARAASMAPPSPGGRDPDAPLPVWSQSPMQRTPSGGGSQQPQQQQQERAASRRYAEIELHLRNKNAELHQLQKTLLSVPRAQRKQHRAAVEACEEDIRNFQGRLLMARGALEQTPERRGEDSGEGVMLGEPRLVFNPEALAGDTPGGRHGAHSSNNNTPQPPSATTRTPLPVRGIWSAAEASAQEARSGQEHGGKQRASLPLARALGTPSVTPERSPSLPLGIGNPRTPRSAVGSASKPPRGTAFQLGQWTPPPLQEAGPGTPDLPSEFAMFEAFGRSPEVNEAHSPKKAPAPLFLQPVAQSEPLSPAQRFKQQRGERLAAADLAAGGLPSFFERH